MVQSISAEAASARVLPQLSVIKMGISCLPHKLALSRGKAGLTARGVGCLCTVLGVTVDVLNQDGLQREKLKYVYKYFPIGYLKESCKCKWLRQLSGGPIFKMFLKKSES